MQPSGSCCNFLALGNLREAGLYPGNTSLLFSTLEFKKYGATPDWLLFGRSCARALPEIIDINNINDMLLIIIILLLLSLVLLSLLLSLFIIIIISYHYRYNGSN
jgi:hypothetical protein